MSSVQSGSRLTGIWKQWRICLLVFASLIIMIRLCIADWSLIFSGSMNPTLYEGEIILTNKVAYDFQVPFTPIKIPRSDPQRCDIAVFRSPERDEKLIKRIVAVPGDTVQIRNNLIYINDKPLQYEPLPDNYSKYVPDRHRAYSLFYREISEGCTHRIMVTPGTPPQLSNLEKTIVPVGRYFVLGDNRSFSRDSRMYGFVDRENFIGRTSKVLLSFSGTSILQPRTDRFFNTLY
ncbi:MAG: signal peptidase I [Verrucomicrobiota bacterium]